MDFAALSQPGILTYTITIVNTGNTSLSNIVVTDILPDGSSGTLTGPTGDVGAAGVLEIDETWTYSITYSVSQDEIDAGTSLVNTATVDTDQTDSLSDSATTTIDRTSSLTINKDVDFAALSQPGILTYTITIVNTGNTSLSNIAVIDILPDGSSGILTGPTGDVGAAGVLDINETWTYSTTYNVTQDDIDAGVPLVNIAVVDTDETGPEQDEATTTITQNADLTIQKDVDIDEIAAPGTLTYTITVENTGSVSLTNVELTDDFATTGPTLIAGDNGDGILQIDETWTYTATYIVTQGDINQGDDLVNTAIVDTDQTGPEEDEATTTITQNADLTIQKDVDIYEIAGPGTLAYTITVENTGSVSLTNVGLTDDFATTGPTLIAGDNGDGILQIDETWTYTATYNVTQGDINQGDDLVNTAIVDTDQTRPEEDEATTTITQNADLTIQKDVDIDEISAPGTLTYTITVENTGSVSLTNVELTDDFATTGPTLTAGR